MAVGRSAMRRARCRGRPHERPYRHRGLSGGARQHGSRLGTAQRGRVSIRMKVAGRRTMKATMKRMTTTVLALGMMSGTLGAAELRFTIWTGNEAHLKMLNGFV